MTRAGAALVAWLGAAVGAACDRAPPPVAPAPDAPLVVVVQGESAAGVWRAHVVARGAQDSGVVAALGAPLDEAVRAARPASAAAVVDLVHDALVARGRTDFLVERGGVLRGRGRDVGAQPWTVDLGGREVTVQDGAVVVDGDRIGRGATAAAAAGGGT